MSWSLRFFRPRSRPWRAYERALQEIRRRQSELTSLPDHALQSLAADLRAQARGGVPVVELVVAAFALVSVASGRVLGLEPFDVQILGALALYDGKIVEMQTGEGKTLAAVLPVYLEALAGRGAHVWTANDYLARRDAAWMGPLYRFLGLTVEHVRQGMSLDQRRQAYAADVTYATANEVGFDYLRDHLRRRPDDLVQRPFHFALIDEADSILIDEARIPLVIAGGDSALDALAPRVAGIVATLRPGLDFSTDEYARNVQLTETGAERVEIALRCGNLYELSNLELLAAVNAALHARILLRRDVDYIVKDHGVELVDEFKGRIAENRRWPDGIQAALEARESLPIRRGGRIFGSLTLQNLVSLYPRVCGMTGTAATQAEEFRRVYGLRVIAIPTHRPVIRVDHSERIFRSKAAKEQAVVEEILRVHATGRPILVGTASVEESERLSRLLTGAGIPSQVLNARQDEAEARIIAQAGGLGVVTVSTNMAGRGTDIVLGEGVVALGGLYVLGTNRHEARRIDHQLRGRAGRQGDPGDSCFFLSLEDDLLVRYGLDEPHSLDHAQRVIEGQNLDIRQTLWKYESLLESQRRVVHELRRAVLLGEAESLLAERALDRRQELSDRFGTELIRQVERDITLAKIDEHWSDYLTAVAELRDGIHWQSYAGKDPVHEFRTRVVELFDRMLEQMDDEVVEAFETAEITAAGIDLARAGLLDTSATWTYLTTDQPFGTLAERLGRGLKRKWREGRFWG